MLVVSEAEYLDYMLLTRPGDVRAPYWRKRALEKRVQWVKRTLRSGRWPWSAGPKGWLP